MKTKVAAYLEFSLTYKVRENQGILLVVKEKRHVSSDCATVAVLLCEARSVTSYFGLDFYYLFCYF